MFLGSQEARCADAVPAKAACHIDLKVIARSLPATVSGSFKVVPTAEFDTFSEDDKKLVYEAIPADKIGKRIWPVFERSLCAEDPKVMADGAKIIEFLKAQAQRLGLIPAGTDQPFSGVDAAFMIRLGNALSGGMDLPLLGDRPTPESLQLVLLVSGYSLRALKQLAPTANKGINISKVAVPQNLTKTAAEFAKLYGGNKDLIAALDKMRLGEKSMDFKDPLAQNFLIPFTEAYGALARYRIRLSKTSLVAGVEQVKTDFGILEKEMCPQAEKILATKRVSDFVSDFGSYWRYSFLFSRVSLSEKVLYSINPTTVRTGMKNGFKWLEPLHIANLERFLPWLTTVGTSKDFLSPFSLAISALNRVETTPFVNADQTDESDPCRVFSELQGKPDVRATAAEICVLLAKKP